MDAHPDLRGNRVAELGGCPGTLVRQQGCQQGVDFGRDFGGCAFGLGAWQGGDAVLLPAFEVEQDGCPMAVEELGDAWGAPALCGESEGKGASSGGGCGVGVVDECLEVVVLFRCQPNEYGCSHVEIIPQRHLIWVLFSISL